MASEPNSRDFSLMLAYATRWHILPEVMHDNMRVLAAGHKYAVIEPLNDAYSFLVGARLVHGDLRHHVDYL